ncbi:hypothetical protein Hanom_Chr11g01034051 [Helianthus anomalus]
MTVSYASRDSLPCHLPPVPSNLQAVAVVLRLVIVPHKSQERDINGRHSQLERLKMETEVLAVTTKYLKCQKKKTSLTHV